MPTLLKNLKTMEQEMPRLQNQYYGGNFEQLCKNIYEVFDKHIYSAVRDFFDQIYNIDTADAVGLELWGKLLDFPRVIRGVNQETGEVTIYNLDDNQYRIILKVLAINMKTNMTIPEINASMMDLFKSIDGVEKKTSIADNRDMTALAYFFEWNIPSWLKTAFENYELLPHPMGVGVKVASAIVRPIGFKGQESVATDFYQAYWSPKDEERTSKVIGMEGQSYDSTTNWNNGIYPKGDNPKDIK